jgi:hypothetical protein
MATPSKARGVREGEGGGLITDEIVEVAADGLMEVCYGQELPEAPIDLARAALEAAAPLIAGRALNEAADTWQRGAWADAPRRADRVQERIANGQHVGDWLRGCADRIEARS